MISTVHISSGRHECQLQSHILTKWQTACYFLLCSAHFKRDPEGKSNQTGGVQWHSSSHVLCVQRLVPVLCVAEGEQCGRSQWGSTAQQWKRHPHHSQHYPLRRGSIQVQCVQWCQLWNQSPSLSEHQLWVVTKGKYKGLCIKKNSKPNINS